MRHGLIISRLESHAHPPRARYNWPVSYCSQSLKCASAARSVDAALRAALLVASALASGYPLGREIAGTAPDRGPKNGRLANPFGKATIFNQLQRHSRLVAPAGCTDWQLYLLTYYTQTQMHRRSTQGRGGPPQPGPPHPGRPHPGPPQPRPPCQPPPCQPPPPPCQPANCAWWTTPEAAGGVGAAFATPARPMAEKLSAPATAPAPTILFRIMPIPSLIWNSWLENLPGWYILDDR
jgi:hypothetical protein